MAASVLLVAEERKVMAIIVLAEASVRDRASSPAAECAVVAGEATLVSSRFTVVLTLGSILNRSSVVVTAIARVVMLSVFGMVSVTIAVRVSMAVAITLTMAVSAAAIVAVVTMITVVLNEAEVATVVVLMLIKPEMGILKRLVLKSMVVTMP